MCLSWIVAKRLPCKFARSQVSMPMPTGWDVRCAGRMGCCGGSLRDPWSEQVWFLLRLGDAE